MIQYINRFTFFSVLVTCIFFLMPPANAQTDTVKQYRDFLSLCTNYQYAPLQLKISYKAENNLVLTPYDTLSMQGYFYIGGNGIYYLRMGDVEQLITDSIALMVNHTLRQVFINSDAANARVLLTRYLGNITNDTSLHALTNAYHIEQNTRAGNGVYSLLSRSYLPGTSIPRQSITLEYDPVSREPKSISTLRRTLVPVDAADSAAFAQKFAGKNVLVTLPNASTYFVRTYNSLFSYIDIQHQEPLVVPMRVRDYVLLNKQGEYELVPEKSGYRLKYE